MLFKNSICIFRTNFVFIFRFFLHSLISRNKRRIFIVLRSRLDLIYCHKASSTSSSSSGGVTKKIVFFISYLSVYCLPKKIHSSLNTKRYARMSIMPEQDIISLSFPKRRIICPETSDRRRFRHRRAVLLDGEIFFITIFSELYLRMIYRT